MREGKKFHQIAVGIVRSGDEILLVEQQGPGDPTSEWALPGGRAEPGELLNEALVREVAEETGIVVAKIGPLAYIAQFDHPTAEGIIGTGTKGHGYLATIFVFEIQAWRGEIHVDDPDQFILHAKFLPLDDAITKLDAIPLRVMREPIVAYLRDETKAGAVWFYRRQADGADVLTTCLNIGRFA